MSRSVPSLNPRLLGFKCIRCDAIHEIGDYAEGCPLCSKAGYPVSVAPVYSSLPPLAATGAGYGMQRVCASPSLFHLSQPWRRQHADRSARSGGKGAGPSVRHHQARSVEPDRLSQGSHDRAIRRQSGREECAGCGRRIERQRRSVAGGLRGSVQPQMRHRHDAEDQSCLAPRDRDGRRGHALCRRSA